MCRSRLEYCLANVTNYDSACDWKTYPRTKFNCSTMATWPKTATKLLPPHQQNCHFITALCEPELKLQGPENRNWDIEEEGDENIDFKTTFEKVKKGVHMNSQAILEELVGKNMLLEVVDEKFSIFKKIDKKFQSTTNLSLEKAGKVIDAFDKALEIFNKVYSWFEKEDEKAVSPIEPEYFPDLIAVLQETTACMADVAHANLTELKQVVIPRFGDYSFVSSLNLTTKVG